VVDGGRDRWVEALRMAMGGKRFVEQAAIAAGVHERGIDVRLGAPMANALEQTCERGVEPPEIDFKLCVVVMRGAVFGIKLERAKK
jgi:hypothetical protein